MNTSLLLSTIVDETWHLNEILNLINAMSPYLLLGFLFAGILHVFIPGAVYSRYLSGHSFRSVFYATLLGLPLPLCSCGVIPTAMSLRKEGASKGATISFLVTTPETGVDSIIATYSLLGLPFAIVRPITSFFTSLLAGHIVNTFDKETKQPIAINNNNTTYQKETHHNHNNCCETKPIEKKSVWSKIREALDYAFVEILGDIGKWLFIGLFIAGLITICIPDSFFDVFKDSTALSMLLVLCIAIPMYVCATGSIPIAVALLLKGLTPGAALVLLMAGPACNMASILVIRKVLGMKTLVLYLTTIMICSITAGVIIDQLPREWFLPTIGNEANIGGGMTWINYCSTILLIALYINVLIKRYHKPHTHCHCHSHDHEHNHNENTNNCIIDKNMKTYTIQGMNCSHCKASAERAINAIAGVTNVNIDLATGLTEIEGTFTDEQIKEAVEAIGFSVKM